VNTEVESLKIGDIEEDKCQKKRAGVVRKVSEGLGAWTRWQEGLNERATRWWEDEPREWAMQRREDGLMERAPAKEKGLVRRGANGRLDAEGKGRDEAKCALKVWACLVHERRMEAEEEQ
jgi:hypothetical protein